MTMPNRRNKTEDKDLLLEIGCEELPADDLPGFLDWDDPHGAGLAKTAAMVFAQKEIRIPWQSLQAFGTARRLVLLARGVPAILHEEIEGPPVSVAWDAEGRLTEAACGFARRYGVRVSDLKRKSTPKGDRLFLKRKIPLEERLKTAIPLIISSMRLSKTMRWDDSGIRFVRPIRWLICFYGDRSIPIRLGSLCAGRFTYGVGRRRFEPIPVDGIWGERGYWAVLRRERIRLEHGVIFKPHDPDHPVAVASKELKRPKRDHIVKMLRKKAQRIGGRLAEQTTEEFEWLLNQVTFLSEDPHIEIGHFAKEYLDIPYEVLATSMAKYLKLFGVYAKDDGRILSHFLVVLEGRPHRPKQVVTHFERILEARFADARLFFKEDTRRPLASRLDELKQLVFHERLGSVADRTIRLQSLMEALAKQMGLPQSQSRFIPTLAQLAKADLVTQMVREFPSLQGIMAAHYARWEGQPEEVVRALAEQYRPRTVNDPIPETVLGALLSLADRLDFLTGLFGMGYIPTSSADPYGLRRQALGVMRILTESYRHGISFKGLSIDRALESAIESWRLSGMASSADWSNLKMLKGFLWERFDWLAATKGRMQPEWIKAIRMSRCDDPSDAWHRLTIVQKAWGNPSQRLILLKAAKVAERTGRMVQAAKDDLQPGEVRPEAMRELVEKRLWDRWTALKPKVLERIRCGRYWEGIELYSQLYPDIHEFFLKVFVMDEDPHVRKNRLTLMQEIHGTLSEHFADLSVLPLPKEIPDGSHEGIKGEVCV